MQSTRPSAARPADTTTQKSAPQRRAPRATGCALQGGSSVLTRTAPPPRSAPYLATEGATVKQNARLGGRLSAQMRWHGLSYSGIERSAARLQIPHAGAPVSLVRQETSPRARLRVAALRLLPLASPVHELLPVRPVFPKEMEELPGVQFGSFLPKEGLKSPTKIRTFPRFQPVPPCNRPVVAQHVPHSRSSFFDQFPESGAN